MFSPVKFKTPFCSWVQFTQKGLRGTFHSDFVGVPTFSHVLPCPTKPTGFLRASHPMVLSWRQCCLAPKSRPGNERRHFWLSQLVGVGWGRYQNPASRVQDATTHVTRCRTTSHTREHPTEGQPATVKKPRSNLRSWSVTGSWMISCNPCGSVAKNKIEATRCQARSFSYTKSSLLPLRFSEKETESQP